MCAAYSQHCTLNTKHSKLDINDCISNIDMEMFSDQGKESLDLRFVILAFF